MRDELRHTFWMLNRVDSARALAKMLRQHEVFKYYEIILAAGDGKIDDDEENEKSFDKVRDAIAKAEKGGETPDQDHHLVSRPADHRRDGS